MFYLSPVQTPVAPVKAVEKQPQQKKESDHIMAGIFEEVRQSTLK